MVLRLLHLKEHHAEVVVAVVQEQEQGVEVPGLALVQLVLEQEGGPEEYVVPLVCR